MKKQKKPKQKLKQKPTSQPVSLVPTAPPSRLIRLFKVVGVVVGSAVGLAVTAGGLVAFVDFCRDQYGRTIPEIAPKEDTSVTRLPPIFVVKNASPYFSMNDVHLLCGIETASFDVGGGKHLGFASPITSGVSNPSIPPGKNAEYRCDPNSYLKFENGRISLLGMTTEHPMEGVSNVRLSDATVWIGVGYRTFLWPKERQTKSNVWKYDPDTFRWNEIRPIFK